MSLLSPVAPRANLPLVPLPYSSRNRTSRGGAALLLSSRVQRLWCGHEVGTELEVCQGVVVIAAEASVRSGAVEDLVRVLGA